MYKKLVEDLGVWDFHNIGCIGRINSVKMTLLPRLLYLFRSLPILIKRNHLKTFQGKIIKFIWNKKGPRIASCSLFNLTTQGGLGLPNLLWYYQAARLAQLSDLYLKIEQPNWISIENQASPTFSLESLLWCPSKSRPSILCPTLSQSLAFWDSIRGLPSLISKLQPLANLFKDPIFS